MRRLTTVPVIAMLAVALMLGPGLQAALRHRDALAEPLRWLYLAFFAAVLVLATSALCLLLSARLARAALLAASGAALVLGAGLILGTLLREIPCLGPS